jgi:hypothetical protein
VLGEFRDVIVDAVVELLCHKVVIITLLTPVVSEMSALAK